MNEGTIIAPRIKHLKKEAGRVVPEVVWKGHPIIYLHPSNLYS
jgi:hypothetical protein